jgi:hypothetical protein
MTKEELEGVGYFKGDLAAVQEEYHVAEAIDGWNESKSGERFYFIRNPGLGLWMNKHHPHAF